MAVPPQYQVFINFRGKDLRRGFVSHLVDALIRNSINVFMDEFEDRGKHLDALLKRIEGSKVALAIFSENYTDSKWCLKEAEKMYDCMGEGNLVVIPIFYKVEPSTVRYLKGDFGDKLWILAKGDEKKKKWEEVLKSIPNLFGITVDDRSDECQTINDIVKAVKTALFKISLMESQTVSVEPSESSDDEGTFGVKQRLEEMEDKLDCVKYKGTRIIGVVGMPGIGKTTLIKELFKKWERKFFRHALVDKVRVKSKDLGCDYLPKLLVQELLALEDRHTKDGDPHKKYKRELLEYKVLVILDDVSKKEQIDALLGKQRDWISEGSRIVIATNDTSLISGLVDDTYVVQSLNLGDSLDLFHYHANLPKEDLTKEDFAKLSEKFVHYARGHPLVLKMLGVELNKNDIKQWKSKLEKLAQNPNPHIGSVLKLSYDELSPEQKDAFLDVACFRSQDVDYVKSLLPLSADALEDLTKKYLINTSDGRVEMHDLLYEFSRELDPKASTQNGTQYWRLWRRKDIIKGGVINVLQNKMMPINVRGIFLDLSEVKGEICLDRKHFKKMVNLRYLKFYNSHCPQDCKTNNKINIPDGLKLPLKEVRCLHWLKFPLEELPNKFHPINLVDLKLPYSEIQRLWEGDKDTPLLKWVDLNHSSKLCSLSGLSKAKNLQRLNLEGCTTLKTLPPGMEEMDSLAFLNLKGCASLESLPEMNLVSLKTLTLSGCSNFKEFPLISENIEILYLDGTAISQLPENMEKLQRLVVLNMRSCKMLEKIPDRVGELKALQELLLSDCSNLNYFPEINMISLNILLLDGTAIEVMPQLPSLQYLCLSRNDKISCLPAGMSKLLQLKWLDLKYCTSLTSVPEFPPNLQCLDAHGCSSLKTVSKPLARIMPTEQNHSTFIFTNCENLEQAAKEEIISYAQRKCQLLSYARKRYNGDLVSEALFSTCFPGREVPSWFCHETVGSELEVQLLPHWHDKRLAGIALCAVVSFRDCQEQISCLSVTCTFKVKVEEKSWVPFTCPVGSWTRQGDGKYKIESDHIFIGYTSCPYTIKCPEGENSDKCSSTEACLEFTVTDGTNEKGKFKVLKCGLGLVYAKDMSFQETSKGVDGGTKKKKKTRGGDRRPKKKQKSRRDDHTQCQSNSDASVPRGKDNSVARHIHG